MLFEATGTMLYEIIYLTNFYSEQASILVMIQ
jgi:hypothetical protein